MLYRALTKVQRSPGEYIGVSSVGMCEGKSPVEFEHEERYLFFGPEYGYEVYGCEDPRISKVGGSYFIFYTSVADFPPKPQDVRLALATTKDFESYEKLGVACPFNSKAGAIFPKRIGGQLCLIFTLYPDIPPSQLAIVYFSKISELFEKEFWEEWNRYFAVEERTVRFDKVKRPPFVEVGSQPIETEEGWLMFIPDILYEGGNFLEFRITAILLDRDDPRKLIAMAKEPLLTPEVGYEKMGRAYPLTKIAMPTSALVEDGKVYVYYGASDLFCCVAYCDYEELLKYLVEECRV